jgi:hypothetical protein
MTVVQAETAFARMLASLRRRYPPFAGQWEETRRLFGERWERDFSALIARSCGANPSAAWDDVLDGYVAFTTDALRAQVFFERHGRYQASRYAIVNAECYQNADFMLRRYLPGLLLSHYVWPHHYRLLEGFRTRLLPGLRSARTFYEVGVGCGMYSLAALQALPDTTGVGIDVSPHALEFTDGLLRAHAMGHRYAVVTRDIVAEPGLEPADLVISQEVLEHLEDPPAFLRALRGLVRPRGTAYITAAVNAGHTDHIYLYRSPAEVRAQLEAAGWIVTDSQVESACLGKPPHLRPTVAGFLVRCPR